MVNGPTSYAQYPVQSVTAPVNATTSPPVQSNPTATPATTSPPSAPTRTQGTPTPSTPRNSSFALNRSNGTDQVQISQQAVNSIRSGPPSAGTAPQTPVQTTNAINTSVSSNPSVPRFAPNQQTAAVNAPTSSSAPTAASTPPNLVSSSPIQDLLPGQSINVVG